MNHEEDFIVPFRVQYSRLLDTDHSSALMLAQIIYWFSPDKKGKPKVQKFRKGDDGKLTWWLAKSNKDWLKELDLSRGQAQRCLAKLEGKGLINTWLTNFSGHPTVHVNLTFARGRMLTAAELENFHRSIGVEGAAVTDENGVKTGVKTDSHCTKRDSPLRDSAHSITETTTETTKFLSAASPPTVAEGSKGTLNSISIPKKRRVLVDRPDSATAVLAQHNAKKVQVAATRIADASAGDLTVQSLQALLDKHMAHYHPSAPRLLVTAKAFGVLRKRVNEFKIQDINHFFDFTVREWGKIAGQNRAAFLKNPSKARLGSRVPDKPTFIDLAYRLPYFVAVYSQDLGEKGTLKKSVEDENVARLKARAEAAERENKNNRDIIRRMAQSKAATPSTAPRVSRTTTLRRTDAERIPENKTENTPVDDGLSDDWLPPEWPAATPTMNKFVRRRTRNV